MCGGSGASSRQKGSNQGTSTYTPAPAAGQAYQSVLDLGQQDRNLPYTPITQGVAGLTPQQNAAMGQITDAYQASQPYMGMAASDFQMAANPLTASDINQFYNPYVGAVQQNLGETFAEQNRLNNMQNNQAAGGIGNDRSAVSAAEMSRQQGLAAGATYANIYQNALQAGENWKGMQQASGYGLGNLGSALVSNALGAAGQLFGFGTVGQQTNQAGLNAIYNQQLAQQAFPYQQAQWYSNMVDPNAAGLGGTTSQQGKYQGTYTPPAPSMLGGAASGAMMGNSIMPGGKGALFGAGLGAVGSIPGIKRGGAVKGYAVGGSPYMGPQNIFSGGQGYMPPAGQPRMMGAQNAQRARMYGAMGLAQAGNMRSMMQNTPTSAFGGGPSMDLMARTGMIGGNAGMGSNAGDMGWNTTTSPTWAGAGNYLSHLFGGSKRGGQIDKEPHNILMGIARGHAKGGPVKKDVGGPYGTPLPGDEFFGYDLAQPPTPPPTLVGGNPMTGGWGGYRALAPWLRNTAVGQMLQGNPGGPMNPKRELPAGFSYDQAPDGPTFNEPPPPNGPYMTGDMFPQQDQAPPPDTTDQLPPGFGTTTPMDMPPVRGAVGPGAAELQKEAIAGGMKPEEAGLTPRPEETVNNPLTKNDTPPGGTQTLPNQTDATGPGDTTAPGSYDKGPGYGRGAGRGLGGVDPALIRELIGPGYQPMVNPFTGAPMSQAQQEQFAMGAAGAASNSPYAMGRIGAGFDAGKNFSLEQQKMASERGAKGLEAIMNAQRLAVEQQNADVNAWYKPMEIFEQSARLAAMSGNTDQANEIMATAREYIRTHQYPGNGPAPDIMPLQTNATTGDHPPTDYEATVPDTEFGDAHAPKAFHGNTMNADTRTREIMLQQGEKRVEADDAALEKQTKGEVILSEMRSLASKPDSAFLQFGPGSEWRTNVAKSVNYLRSITGQEPYFKQEDVANLEALWKDTTWLGYGTSATMGSREAVQIVKGAIAANPSAANSPLGFRVLQAGIQAGLDRNRDWVRFEHEFQMGNKGDISQAQDIFNKSRPASYYARKATVMAKAMDAVANGQATKEDMSALLKKKGIDPEEVFE